MRVCLQIAEELASHTACRSARCRNRELQGTGMNDTFVLIKNEAYRGEIKVPFTALCLLSGDERTDGRTDERTDRLTDLVAKGGHNSW